MQQQGGRPQYGASPPEMTPFAAASTSDPRTHMLGVGVGAATDQQQQQQLKLGDPSMGAAEEASPISSRPPAAAHFSTAANIEELLPGTAAGVGGLPDDDALGGDEADRGGVSGGNRWPRQETLALLKIRSDMDAVFRDASLKGPLWDDVSRKLAELGYKRSAKKCKEKFENVHKYYKRTKEGRAGRQDGKSYRFFTQLEALHNTVVSAPTPPTLAIASTSEQIISPVPVSIGIGVANPIPVSSVRIPTPLLAAAPQAQAQVHPGMGVFPPDFSAAAAVPTSSGPIGVSFSSDSSSSSSESDEMDEDEDEMELERDLMEGEAANTESRKRKRGSSSKQHGSSSSERMMEFFEGLMKQVMQKQEAMQQRFLEAIEKREQDRMIREEAWKRQEMARLAREHDLMAQERAISASRDSAIIAFLQKITGQTIQLPQAVTVPAAPPPPPPPAQAPVSVSVPTPQPPSTSSPRSQLYQKPQQPPSQHYQQQQPLQLVHHHQHQHPQTSSAEVARKHQPPSPPPPPMSSAIVVAVPEQQVPPQEMGEGGRLEATSSRWPKAEVLALIKLRSGLEPRYQEAGPKGPLWEEISAGMLRMGYKRNPKRCKEKWENINKYFKKVKESNKKRPEDAKTCPYFHELDALYRKKILGSPGGGSSSLVVSQNRLEDQQQQQVGPTIFQERSDVPAVMLSIQATPTVTESENKDIVIQTSNGGLTASLFGEASDTGAAGGGPKKPEDIVKEQKHKQQQPLMRNDFDSENLDLEEEDYNDEDDEDGDEDDEEDQEEMKMAYKIQFQRQNTGSSNGGGNGAPSFLAMVQ